MTAVSTPVQRLFSFVGSNVGGWLVDRIEAIAGAPLLPAHRLSVTAQAAPDHPADAAWVLRGITSNVRCT